MKFWKWYLKGILRLLRVLFSLRALQAPISPWGEYTIGILALVLASLLLGKIVSPLWLLLTIPGGATLAAHGIWRAEVKNK